MGALSIIGIPAWGAWARSGLRDHSKKSTRYVFGPNKKQVALILPWLASRLNRDVFLRSPGPAQAAMFFEIRGLASKPICFLFGTGWLGVKPTCFFIWGRPGPGHQGAMFFRYQGAMFFRYGPGLAIKALCFFVIKALWFPTKVRKRQVL